MTTAAGDVRLRAFRDDGPLADPRWTSVTRRFPAGVLVLTLVGSLPLAVVDAVSSSHHYRAGMVVGCLWFVLVAGAAAGRPHIGRFDWAVPAILRAVEYATLLRLAALAGSPAAGFVFVAAVVYHHYDIAYRVQNTGSPPPRWVSTAAGGWGGRLVVAVVVTLAGICRPAYVVLAVLLGVLFLFESVAHWRRAAAGRK